MNLRNKNLKLIFLACCLFTLIFPSLFPHVHLLYFAPFLVIALYQKSLAACLWYAALCGLSIDLLSDGNRLGFYALNYSLTTLLLFPQRKNFFSDSISTLPLMSFLFSALSTVVEIASRFSMGTLPTLSLQWAFTDLIAMPAADALFAFALFILPHAVFGKPERKGRDYFIPR